MHASRLAGLVALLLFGPMACTDDTTITPSSAAAAAAAPAPDASAPPRVLIYTKQTEWIHPSTETGTKVMNERGKARGWVITTSKDSTVFTAESLAKFDVVFFLNT